MSDGEEEDPFDVFGCESDDDDRDSDDGIENNDAAIARSLVQAANQKIALPDVGQAPAYTTTPPQTEDRGMQDLSHLTEWKNSWPEPLYKGKILLANLPVGGGRGYVATETIPPGTLILVESPMIEWPEEQLGKKLGIVSVKHLIEHPNANQFLHDLEDFHPTKERVDGLQSSSGSEAMDTLDDEHVQITKMMDLLRKEHSFSPEETSEETQNQKAQELVDLVNLAQKLGVRSWDGTALTSTDIIRLLLVLRYNGLESGVYRHVAMLNHDDHPNCAKLLPTDGKAFSEVRTTRLVSKGEALNISYISRTVSHATRRKMLWEQHRFDIGVKHLKGDRYKMELIGKSFPPSPIHGGSDETLTDRIERTTEDLEKMQAEIEASQESPESLETAKALEQTLLELYKASVEQLQNADHILLVPILNLHIEICTIVLKDGSLTNSNQLGVLSRQTLSGYDLLPLQKTLLGQDHFAIARTSLDLAECIAQLLSRSPKSLYDLKVPSMTTFAAWSKFEHEMRKEHNRVRALYPHDVEKHIKT
mmetsp:Transcript_1482/g.3437  ORF Transcript_1482/g.3437 Transcript_1482/m.3437 type:complete len:534 (-) Transcript_1482:33-1634(-)